MVDRPVVEPAVVDTPIAEARAAILRPPGGRGRHLTTSGALHHYGDRSPSPLSAMPTNAVKRSMHSKWTA